MSSIRNMLFAVITATILTSINGETLKNYATSNESEKQKNLLDELLVTAKVENISARSSGKVVIEFAIANTTSRTLVFSNPIESIHFRIKDESTGNNVAPSSPLLLSSGHSVVPTLTRIKASEHISVKLENMPLTSATTIAIEPGQSKMLHVNIIKVKSRKTGSTSYIEPELHGSYYVTATLNLSLADQPDVEKSYLWGGRVHW